MTSVGNLGVVQQFLPAGSSNTSSGSSITSLISSNSSFGTTSPMAELGIMSGINDPINIAAMATPYGPALNIMQMLGFPSLSELFKSLGVDKILSKVPGIGSLTKGLSEGLSGIKKGISGAVKSVGGAVKKVAKKL